MGKRATFLTLLNKEFPIHIVFHPCPCGSGRLGWRKPMLCSLMLSRGGGWPIVTVGTILLVCSRSVNPAWFGSFRPGPARLYSTRLGLARISAVRLGPANPTLLGSFRSDLQSHWRRLWYFWLTRRELQQTVATRGPQPDCMETKPGDPGNVWCHVVNPQIFAGSVYALTTAERRWGGIGYVKWFYRTEW